MFYKSHLPDNDASNQVSALVVLTPSESKRLIARAVANLPEVKRALAEGLIIIARGTANTFAAEEIMDIVMEPKSEYSRGCIVCGELRVNAKRGGRSDFVLRKGQMAEITPQEAIKEFTRNDIFIKGANAVDSSGEAAALAAGDSAGTIGNALATLVSRASHLIVPVGLEKLIPSVAQASPKCGIYNFKYSTGLPCALVPLINAEVVTEVQAFEVLTGSRATHVASGGIGGSEGAVVLTLEGDEDTIDRAFELVKAIKGEPPVPGPEQTTPVAAGTNYNPAAQLDALNR